MKRHVAVLITSETTWPPSAVERPSLILETELGWKSEDSTGQYGNFDGPAEEYTFLGVRAEHLGADLAGRTFGTFTIR